MGPSCRGQLYLSAHGGCRRGGHPAARPGSITAPPAGRARTSSWAARAPRIGSRTPGPTRTWTGVRRGSRESASGRAARRSGGMWARNVREIRLVGLDPPYAPPGSASSVRSSRTRSPRPPRRGPPAPGPPGCRCDPCPRCSGTRPGKRILAGQDPEDLRHRRGELLGDTNVALAWGRPSGSEGPRGSDGSRSDQLDVVEHRHVVPGEVRSPHAETPELIDLCQRPQDR